MQNYIKAKLEIRNKIANRDYMERVMKQLISL